MKVKNLHENMNALYEPWISVIDVNGEESEVGLFELFSNLENYYMLNGSPYSILSLFRFFEYLFLLSNDIYENDIEWEKGKELDFDRNILKYLKENEDKFYLGKETPFLQIKSEDLKVKEDGKKPILDTLDFQTDLGKNGQLFHTNYLSEKDMDNVEINIFDLLLRSIYFSPSGLCQKVFYKNKENNNSVGKLTKYISGVNYYFLGKNLKETIWLNLPTKEYIENKLGYKWRKSEAYWDLDYESFFFNQKEIEGRMDDYIFSLCPLRKVFLIDIKDKKCIGWNHASYTTPESIKNIELLSPHCLIGKEEKLINAELPSEKEQNNNLFDIAFLFSNNKLDNEIFRTRQLFYKSEENTFPKIWYFQACHDKKESNPDLKCKNGILNFGEAIIEKDEDLQNEIIHLLCEIKEKIDNSKGFISSKQINFTYQIELNSLIGCVFEKKQNWKKAYRIIKNNYLKCMFSNLNNYINSLSVEKRMYQIKKIELIKKKLKKIWEN